MSAGDRNPFETDLDKNPANYMPMHPSRFLERSAEAFPFRTAMIHGARRFTYAEQHERSVRLTSALAKRGIGAGDTVALMGSNTPESLEAHFGVPMTGALLDRITHHVHILEMNGESYRLKQSRSRRRTPSE